MSAPLSVSRRRLRALGTTLLGAVLLGTLLPVEAVALPPDPAKSETPREEIALDALPAEAKVPGGVQNTGLKSIAADTPAPQNEAPPGTATPPAGGAGTVTFGSPAPLVNRADSLSAASATAEAGLEPAGPLPVRLGPAPGAAVPTGTWGVTMADRATTTAGGIDGALLTVTAPADGTVPVQVQLDYRTYENLYGADWASRLTFVQFPECYRTTPEAEECQAYEELDTVNDTDGKTLTAVVDPSADGSPAPAMVPQDGLNTLTAVRASIAAAGAGDSAVVGAVDSGAGEGGSFKATPLLSSGQWTAGGSSGAFTWSYPLTVPPTPAGPLPKVSFDYNSQTVDGKTATTSPQASWVGEGWSYDPGHIERRYRPCKDDTAATSDGPANNAGTKPKSSDLCWVSDNAVLTHGGSAVELVKVGTGNVYRPKTDDGTRVERKTGGTNGDDDGEYWIVTSRDGVRSYYGLNKVVGHDDTNSVFTVPVFGNHEGEPCHSGTFAASRCGKEQQAWHWGLDKVVDVHGNVMIVNWRKEQNHYAVNRKFSSPEPYVRGGAPVSIEYGMREGALGAEPAARVDFELEERCLLGGSACDPTRFDNTADPASYRPWWDTPGNLNCKSSSKMCPAFPSFWSRYRLGAVTTYAHRPGTTGLGKVDRYVLGHSFPRNWYDSAPGLWLQSITRYGFAPGVTTGVPLSPAGVTFKPYVVGTGPAHPLNGHLPADAQLPNLVPRYADDPRPGITRPRIGAVATEHGGDIEVTYAGGCAKEPTVAPESNHGTCFPVKWSPDAENDSPRTAWFNKYVVHTVTETDRITGVSDRIVTRYEYADAAWAKSEDEFARPTFRTHSDWRGYRRVDTYKGSQGPSGEYDKQRREHSATRYFLGTGGVVKDSADKETLAPADLEPYAGMTAETLVYGGAGAKVARRTLAFPWSKQTASRAREGGLPVLTAHRKGIRRTDDIRPTGTGWESIRTETEVEPDHGMPAQVESSVVTWDGQKETVTDPTCVTTSYVENPDETVNIFGLAKEIRSTATPCAAQGTADPATRLIRTLRTSYDDKKWGESPTKGMPTSASELDAGGTGFAPPSTTTYDPLGRPRKVTNPLGGVTEKIYTPGDEGGALTGLKTINPKKHSTSTTLDPGRGLTLTSTDTNNRVIRIEYDALGRLVKGWSAARSAGGPADVVIDYQMARATTSENRPTAVTVNSLKDDGTTYARQVTLYDGLMRPVQEQREAHGTGRLVTDTSYDDRGHVRERTGAYLAPGEPQTKQFKRANDTLVPTITRSSYDGLGRSTNDVVYHGGTAVSSNWTEYGDNWTLRVSGTGATPAVRTYTDARGRVTKIEHSTDRFRDDWRGTSYGYDARGNRTLVRDHAGNEWTYTFDARGLLVASRDPDIGDASFTYDALGRQTSATDSKQRTTFTEYDAIGRILAVRQGSATAAPVKEFTYDMPGSLGKPWTSTRHDATGDWIERVTSYDSEYRVTGKEFVVPAHASTVGLAGTYAYATTYTPGGKPLTTTLPAVAGLSQEKVVTRYNDDGLPESTSGLTWYTADVTYSAYGEPLRTVSGPQPFRVWTTNFVDQNSGRLQRAVWDRETTDSHRITDAYYSYDGAGNVTSAARKETTGTTSTWDNQCFTYDYLGELVNAWTSNRAGGTDKGCGAAEGTTWGYQADGRQSSGPIAEAPDAVTDATTPDDGLQNSLTRAGPATGSVTTTGAAYWQSYTYDVVGNRASLTEHNPANPALDQREAYGYGVTVPNNGTQPTTLTQPHILTSVDRPSGTDPTYVAEATGNTTDRNLVGGAQKLTWNAENKLTTTQGAGDGGVEIVSSGKCLDLTGNASTDGTPIQLFRCNDSAAQRWKTTGDTLRIQGKCVTVNGTLVQLATCNGSTAQKFTFRPADKSVLHAATGKCLEIPGGTTADGTDLQVATCAVAAPQQWVRADTVTYVYDAAGNRVLKTSAAGSSLTLGETEVSTDPTGAPIRASRAYAHAGAPTVVRTSAYASTAHKLYVLLADPVGTATTSVELATGQAVMRRSFKPFGETRTVTATWPNSRSYLGTGIDDTETGLTHIGAREYDQSTGRFLSADPVLDLGDPLQINGYAYANNSPITKSDPDGLLPIECWEGMATCSGNTIVAAKNPAVQPKNALTDKKVTTKDGETKRVIYDEKGVPHTIGAPTSKPSEYRSIEYMNEDLRQAGKLYDAKTGNGQEYLWQSDGAKSSVMEGKKGLVHDANGDHRVAGATADFIKVTWMNGKIVSVDTWDVTESTGDTSSKSVDEMAKTINNKMDTEGRKPQTQNVIFWANSVEQAQAVAERFHGNANVRVIYHSGKLGETNIDTHMVFKGFKGGWGPEGAPPSGRSGLKGGGKGGRFVGRIGAAGDIAGLFTMVVLGIASQGCPYDEATCRDMNTA
ncbi:ricin-type beta-trefoil lectin domain protein [Streptomyces sp. NPDC090082]|uniref:ricin-type beta-trefoil lectin domain protein n=1 Tax=unclassified Streptomyces TaxID=2593676 RepID=UPI0037FA0956